MTALSVLNPWAWLLATRCKTFETRSFATPFRGRFCIHASKRFSRKFEQLCFQDPFADAIFGELQLDVNKRLEALKESCGCILATAELTGCFEVDRIRPTLSTNELCFGDYSSGRYAWRIENVQPLKRPVPALGALGFWKLSYELIQKVSE